MNSTEDVKIVLVGDGTVGKSSLFHVFKTKELPRNSEYRPTVFDNHTIRMSICGKVSPDL